jgi:hypothetical protein
MFFLDPTRELSLSDLVAAPSDGTAPARLPREVVLEPVARAGYYNIDHVRSDPAFASLRETEEYRQLLTKLSR